MKEALPESAYEQGRKNDVANGTKSNDECFMKWFLHVDSSLRLL